MFQADGPAAENNASIFEELVGHIHQPYRFRLCLEGRCGNSFGGFVWYPLIGLQPFNPHYVAKEALLLQALDRQPTGA